MISALDTLRQWGLKTYERSPFLIAGPCSAESREQVLATARAISHLPVSLFRAGVWKPHTLPETFPGMGNIALSWLQEAKAETGLPMAIEIDHPAHLDEALQAGIDVFWIGARTTVNPFAVEELAKPSVVSINPAGKKSHYPGFGHLGGRAGTTAQPGHQKARGISAGFCQPPSQQMAL